MNEDYMEKLEQPSDTLFEAGIDYERKRILAMLKKEYGEDYYEMGVVGQVVTLIRGDA